MKKRGYLLVECVLYIWFCAILSTMILILFLPYIKEFKNEIHASTNYNYMLSASIYIESLIFDDSVLCVLENNNGCELKIYKNNEKSGMNIIKINKDNKLVIEHYRLNNEESDLELDDEISNFYDDVFLLNDRNYTKVATNTILKDVESFYVVENRNIICITLKQYGGDERIFCYENKYKK